jgi:hypothetical protein
MCEPIGALLDCATGSRDEPGSKRTGCRDTDLLSQHGTHGAFEWVPGTGDAQSKPLLQEWRQQIVRPESLCDARRIG